MKNKRLHANVMDTAETEMNKNTSSAWNGFDPEAEGDIIALGVSASSCVRFIPVIMVYLVALAASWMVGFNTDRLQSLGVLYMIGYVFLFVSSAVIISLLRRYSADVRSNARKIFVTQITYAWMLPSWSAVITLIDALHKSVTYNVQLYVISNIFIMSVCTMKKEKWRQIQFVTGLMMVISAFIMPITDRFTFVAELIAYLIIAFMGGGFLFDSKRNGYVRQAELEGILRSVEYDDLTGLYTRQAFYHHASEVLSKYPDTRFDLLISDIENFKLINRKYGEKTGDELLRQTGAYLKRSESEKVIMGRYGGDQFVCLMEHNDQIANDASMQAGLDQLSEGGSVAGVVTKFGIYDDVDHSRPVSELCDCAILALRKVKHQYGRLYGKYQGEMQLETRRRGLIEREMQRAFDEDHFKVYYQPKHAASGELAGAEALIRWIHPEIGFMSPAEFIPVFEENGFISYADYYVWRRTCQNLRRWSDEGIDTVPVSVNSSKRDFDMPDYLDIISKPVADNSIDPSMLHLEITESLFIDDFDKVSAVLKECRNRGYRIELDDFGSGYSSLNMVGLLPLDVVKFDMSFMKEINNERKAQVLSSCITLAHNLGLSTVIEGAETEEQVKRVREMGCDMVQGYYYSRPLPEDEFREYLIRHGKKRS